MEAIEAATQDAPSLIKKLRDDLVVAKTKVKAYYSQIGDDSRIIRQLNEERLRKEDHLVRLECLVNDGGLQDRETLSGKLELALVKITNLQHIYFESEKKLEIVERNLSTDNKNLRGKIHSMEREKELIDDQTKSLNINIKVSIGLTQDKEKIIASLSIYRYNATRKRVDGSCRICSKREIDEKERRRIEKILGIPVPKARYGTVDVY